VLPEPTTSEWVAAAAAAALIVTLAALLFIRPAAAERGTTPAGRLAGWLLACLATASVLGTVVLIGAGMRASMISLTDLQTGTGLPTGAFARYLFDADPDATERVAQYAPALLLPFAGTLAVLALAAVDAGRSVGLRLIGGLACVVVVVGSWFVGVGDVGPLAARTALGVGALAAGAGIALGVDHIIGPGRRRA
jgi:hypothetical protein